MGGESVSRRASWLSAGVAGMVSLGCGSPNASTNALVDTTSTTGSSGTTSSTGTGSGSGGGSVDGGGGNDGGDTGDAATNGDAGIPQGGGVGSSCSTAVPCRAGLSCSPANVCQPGRTQPPGSACVVNAECTAGNVCNWVGASRQCAAGGRGIPGSACQSNGDCGDGLRCTIVGFGASCRPEGSADVNGACKTSSDCLGGLSCSAGKCAMTPPGVPPFGVPAWPGATCEADTGPAVSYFRVPRGAADKDFYRLPFPNDIRTKNGHPDLSGHPTPGTELLGFDPVDRYLRAIEQDNDGFGPYSTVFFRFNTNFVLTSAPGKFSVDYVDLTKGADFGAPAVNGMQWLLDYGRNAYICENYFAVRMLSGSTLKPGHTYGVLLHDISVAGTGAPVAADADFTAMLAATAPADPILATAYATYQPLRDYVTQKSIDSSTLLNATVFTVGHPGREIAAIQQAVQVLPTPTASHWVKCGAGPSPCPDATGERGCDATADPAFDELHALVSLPIFQSGVAPYSNPPDGHIDVTAPKVVFTDNVCLSLTVPRGAAMPAAGWPLVIYAHGTGGSFRSHVREGIAKSLATASGDNSVPFAVLGIDQVEHGPRRGASTDSPENLFYNFANPGAARDNAMQGAADQLSLAKLAVVLDIKDTALTGAEIKINPAALVFWGHSQGATEGGVGTPYAPQLAGVVFSGQGASLIDSLLNKTQPVDIADAMAFALSDVAYADPTTHRPHGDIFHPVLSLLQMYLDPADPLNHAAMMAPAASGGHHVFQVYGQNDSYAPPITEVTYAIAAQLAGVLHDPAITKPDFPECAGCTVTFPKESATAVTKNHGGRLTAAVKQYARIAGSDGHFVAYKNPLAQRDIYRFMDDVAKGIAPSVSP